MNFYSLFGQNQEFSLNILELNSTKFLLLRNFPQDKLLYYLPQCEIPREENRTTDEIKKKIKIDEATRQYSNQSNPNLKKNEKMDIEGQGDLNNPYYQKIKDKYFINGTLKFDLTFLNNIDQNAIDFILLTSIDDLFLLPFLFQQKKMKARIYATVPIAQIGQHVLQEYYKLVCNRNKNIDPSYSIGGSNGGNSIFSQHSNLQDSYFQESEFLDLFEREYDLELNQWVEIFSYEDIENVFQRIERMSYGQQLELEGVDIQIEPVSSGYTIGSCIWILTHHSNRIALFNNASKHNYRHTLNLDHSSKLKDSIDFLFITPFLNSTNQYNNLLKQTGATQLSEAYLIKFINQVQDLLAMQKQNIIIPIRDGAIILDLLDILEKKIASFIRHVYIICESALPYIQYGNSNVEFLNERLQKKIFCENPSNPFSAYEFFVKNQNIDILPDFIAFQSSSKSSTLQSLIQSKSQSIYFVVDSSLRLGNTMQLLNLIDESMPKQDEFSSTILLVDPYMQNPNVVAPILGLYRNQVFYTPLDNRMHVQEFCEYIKYLNPKNLIYPRKYQDIQIFLDELREQNNGQRISTSIYGNDEAISLSLYQHQQNALTINKNELKNIKFSKFERLSFLPQLGSIRGVLNSETGQISTRVSISTQMDFDDKIAEDAKQTIVLRYKNEKQRSQAYTNLSNFVTQEITSQGYSVTSSNVSSEGFRIYFKTSNQVDIAYIEHDKEQTLIYCSNKEIQQHMLNYFKSKLNFIELK